MKRTLSFNRKIIDKNLIKIEAEECELTHQPSVGKITYPVIKKVSVNSANFPSNSEIILRLKYDHRHKTINCGKISSPIIPGKNALSKWFGSSFSVSGTVSIIDPISKKILGSNKGRISIFKSESLSSESPFSLEQHDTKPAIWEINTIDESDSHIKIFYSSEIQLSDRFRDNESYLACILPHALRMALNYMVENEIFEESDEDTWPNILLRMVRYLNIPITKEDFFDSSGSFNYQARDFFVQKVVDKWLNEVSVRESLYEKGINILNREEQH